jgi:tetratricopeptide (TPR) repeat protein
MHIMGATCAHAIADIELATGHPVAALTSLNDSEASLSEFGERPMRSTTQAWLALVHERLEAPAAALTAADLADSLSAPEDVFNFATTAGVRARLALAQGDPEAAERWARRAVELAATTDFVRTEAVARLGLGQILAALGQWPAAAEQTRLALAAYEAKGDRGGAAAARALLSAQAA